MLGTQSHRYDADTKDFALLLSELDHRIRNMLTMTVAAVRQTQSASVEDYRVKLIDRISGLYGICEFAHSDGRSLELSELLEQTMRPYAVDGAQVLASGPDLAIEPALSLPLHLVFHELAANASKYGALSSPLGRITIEWELRNLADAPRKLAVIWTEHGGPTVTSPQYRGFGSRLIKAALDGHGAARVDFSSTGLTCFMMIDLDRPEQRQ
jgi:two-component sensor histidine kinase